MRIFIFSFLILLTFNSFAQRKIPIKGDYLTSPYSITTEKNFDETWNTIIDVFMKEGYSIKIIDKTSGLIMSERIVLKYTTEKRKKAELTNPLAVIVVPQYYEPGPDRYSPLTKNSDITGEWNIRVKTIEGKTVISINVVNLKYQFHDTYYHTYREETLSEFKSTGVFEGKIEQAVK